MTSSLSRLIVHGLTIGLDEEVDLGKTNGAGGASSGLEEEPTTAPPTTAGPPEAREANSSEYFKVIMAAAVATTVKIQFRWWFCSTLSDNSISLLLLK